MKATTKLSRANSTNNELQVTFNEKGVGKSGRGVVIQDVNASTAICMGRIRDLGMYSKMVPHVKKVDIYESVKFTNVSDKQLEYKATILIIQHLYQKLTAISSGAVFIRNIS